MSSREIAELTGKQHKHVLDDIRKMLDDLGQTSAEFSADVQDAYGRLQPAFKLPKRETLILVSGYSVELRARIVDRWQELLALFVVGLGPVGQARHEGSIWRSCLQIAYKPHRQEKSTQVFLLQVLDFIGRAWRT